MDLPPTLCWTSLLFIVFLSITTFPQAAHARILNGPFVIGTPSYGVTSYAVRTGFRSCAECAAKCLGDKAAPEVCLVYACDRISLTCTFYTKGITVLGPVSNPHVNIFMFQAHDNYHTVSIKNHPYHVYLSSTTATFSEARSQCHSLGGYLLQFDSLGEIQAVKEVTDRHVYDYLHIGISDQDAEGIWLTDRGGNPLSTGTYPWQPGEPNGWTGENCGLWKVHTQQIIDSVCSIRRYFLCERDV